MRIVNLLIFLSIVLFIVSCNNGHDSFLEPAPRGSYSYTSYDTLGTALVKGWFTMNFQDSSSVIGEWHFEKIRNPKNIGPQVGSGELVGGLNKDGIWINLNPQFIDHNLLLTGIMEDHTYSGEWVWISFIGPTNHGTFEAIQN